MSYWTLKFLEIMIALFYLRHIMLKRCIKYLSTLIICLYLHHMIQKIYLVKNHGDGVLQEKYAQFAISKFVRYLKGTMNFGLPYCGYSPLLKGYCDAN
jgi:hypothetical protein